jgi:hypothetical protein
MRKGYSYVSLIKHPGTPAALLPGKKPLSTHWLLGWVGPRAGMNAVGRETLLVTAASQTPAVQPVI